METSKENLYNDTRAERVKLTNASIIELFFAKIAQNLEKL